MRRQTVIQRGLRLALIFFTVLQGMAGPSSAGEKKSSAYWKEVGLSFSAIDSIIDDHGINQTQCYLNVSRFIACVQALSVLGEAAHPPLTLVTKHQYKKGAPEWGDLVKTFGPLALVQYDPGKTEKLAAETFEEIWTRSQAKLTDSLQSLEKVFRAGRRSRADFKSLISFLKAKVITPENESVLTATVINTYLGSAVDPHTRIRPLQEQLDAAKPSTELFCGVGAVFSPISGKVVITQLIEGGPAHRAGVHVRDVLESVDGQSIEGLSIDDVSKMIRGPFGTQLNMAVFRDGKRTSFSLVRAPVIQERLTSFMLTDLGIPVGYIKLQDFSEPTICERMARKIAELEKQGAVALILDLRANRGGMKDQAVCVSGLFVGKGKTIFKVTDLQLNHRTPYRSTQKKVTNLPMVTLINARSVSAAEAVAGALQDHVRSWIAGDRSYGKATVQEVTPWKPGILIYQTTQLFYQITGRTSQGEGIVPDFPLDPKPDATDEDRFAIREEDHFRNALPRLGVPWTQFRPVQVEWIEDCRKTKGQATRLYHEKMGQLLPADYQVLAAQDILVCDALKREMFKHP